MSYTRFAGLGASVGCIRVGKLPSSDLRTLIHMVRLVDQIERAL